MRLTRRAPPTDAEVCRVFFERSAGGRGLSRLGSSTLETFLQRTQVRPSPATVPRLLLASPGAERQKADRLRASGSPAHPVQPLNPKPSNLKTLNPKP